MYISCIISAYVKVQANTQLIEAVIVYVFVYQMKFKLK